jgi:hypothetical protein
METELKDRASHPNGKQAGGYPAGPQGMQYQPQY